MTRKQQSLASATENMNSSNNTPTTEQATVNGGDSDPQPQLGEIYNLIQQRDRLPFLGLEEHANAEYPDSVNKASPMYNDEPLSFNEVIKLLPEAEEGELHAVNDFVNDDGTVDTAAIEDVDDITIEELSIDPQEISNASNHQPVNDYKDIVDPRRKALSALGYNVKYRWQIATDSYAIINPKDAYFPAYRTFIEKGENDTIFGWVDTRDWGGRVNMYIFFSDHYIEHPDSTDDEDNRIYVGLHTGYDFTGGRALDVKLFGYDPSSDVRFYSLGARRSRRHIGDPNNAEHERKQGRTPIKEWWETEYENLLTWTDDLVNDIERATGTTIDFSNFRFNIDEFYRYLDIPNSYIEDTTDTDTGGIGAVKRAERHSPSSDKYTMWTLFYALSQTLEEEFQGEDHSGSAFKVHADIATNILRSPHMMIERAKREHDRQQQKADSADKTKRERALDGSNDLDRIDSITELDGVSTEDELDLVQKRKIAENSQKSLFNYE